MASGSEVEQIFKASEMLAEQGVDARVVSMPSWEIFEEQSAEYKSPYCLMRFAPVWLSRRPPALAGPKYVGL